MCIVAFRQIIVLDDVKFSRTLQITFKSIDFLNFEYFLFSFALSYRILDRCSISSVPDDLCQRVPKLRKL